MKKLLLLFCLISLSAYGCTVKDTAEIPVGTASLPVQEFPEIEYVTETTGTAAEVTEPLLKLKGCTLRECTRIAGGSAVVWIDGEIYLLKLKD